MVGSRCRAGKQKIESVKHEQRGDYAQPDAEHASVVIVFIPFHNVHLLVECTIITNLGIEIPVKSP